jgi:hypothetical protein
MLYPVIKHHGTVSTDSKAIGQIKNLRKTVTRTEDQPEKENPYFDTSVVIKHSVAPEDMPKFNEPEVKAPAPAPKKKAAKKAGKKKTTRKRTK